MPVGTQASVKALDPRELREMGAQILLGNTYHLAIRPGLEILRAAGGLHQFMNWPGPILTDSGGYQIFSLAKIRKITAHGVQFRSHLDGSRSSSDRGGHGDSTPLGSDIAMAFDDCPPHDCPPRPRRMRLRARSAGPRNAAPSRALPGQPVFGIVQGGITPPCAKSAPARWWRWTSTATPLAGSAWGSLSMR